MIVTIIEKDCISSITLPERMKGQYNLFSNSSKDCKLASIEAINNSWVLKPSKYAKLIDSAKKEIKNTAMSPMSIYVLNREDGDQVFVYTEDTTDDRQTFVKYLIKDRITLSIGRNEKNDICCQNNFVSSCHATIELNNGEWSIVDNSSTNGTFVNEKRVTKAKLCIGDLVYIMGLKIVIGKQFIALNNPDGKVYVKSNELASFSKQCADSIDEDSDEYELNAMEYFFRSPRFKRDIETATFKIDPPPQSPLSEEMPWMLVMGSSFAMGAMSLVTLISALATFNIMSMAMGGSMLLGTVLFPTITKKYEKKQKHKKEEKRQKKYREYLDSIVVKINEECALQAEILCENNIAIQECENRIINAERNLWDREFGQNDFLKIRIGSGSLLLDADITYSERKFSIDEDNLQEELFDICEKPKTLSDVPITYSLFDNFVSGVIGEQKNVFDFAKGVIFQIASQYSYDEVKMVFLYDESDSDTFEFVKWLPHTWNEDQNFRFIATNMNETKEVSAYLEKAVETRKEINENDMDEVKPYFIIFALNKAIADRAEFIKQILNEKENIHFSIVSFCDELRNLPKECSMVVELSEDNGRLFNKNDISGKSVEFIPDISLTNDPLKMSVKLANIPLNTLANGYRLPSMITFLQMFGVGKVEHLNALSRWKENDPTKSLEAAVGVDTLGEIFKLDLHEKFHGPHGLVAGMTGSGKSEFIITYILSLAVNYHPDEVAFILIDYKGGGMAKSFEKLPHTAGIITNLDGAAIKRSLVSIESELKRRQAIFAQASKQINESNIDIYKYQKMYREGIVNEPLQHLFIISDEFAELKAQQPDFMTQLISAARIGRSLGVHLILATQKPSGVVDDQIWSNSKFRVCLKVQDRADSMDMLKRPDAAELINTGRFYLQVGYNELFEMGQSAWSGAPYYPSDKAASDKDNSITVIDRNGHPIKQVKLDTKRSGQTKAKKQLDVITEYLREIADEEHIKVRPLWLEPIPAVILVDELRKKYSVVQEQSYALNPVIGEYDDPMKQQQCVLRLPLSEEGNVVVYGAAGSGKTSFVNATVYSLLQEHTADEVNIYILDFASETLKAFEKAPQVGEVILSYEGEKVSNLFKMLQSEIEKRKKLFADYGGDYNSFIHSSDSKLPSIVVIINNFAAFTEMFEEKEEAISFLSREGTKYGIYFMLTSLGTSGVRFRLLQNFKQLFVLQLNDEADYSTVVGKTDGLFPSKFKGRGLIKKDALYEFQVASLVEDGSPYSFIQKECLKLQECWNGEKARKVPILPEVVDSEFLSLYFDPKTKLSFPIGVEKSTLNVHQYPFGKNYINLIMSTGNEYQVYLGNLTSFICENKSDMGIVVFDVPKSIALSLPSDSATVANSTAACEEQVSKLFDIVLSRNNEYKDAENKELASSKFNNLLVVINSLSSLKSVLSDDANEKLSLVLEKGSPDYHINVIVGEQAKAASVYSFEKWYKAQVTQNNGIWIGSGITEQYQLKANKTTSEMHDEISNDFGYSIQNGKCIKIKLLTKIQEENDNE